MTPNTYRRPVKDAIVSALRGSVPIYLMLVEKELARDHPLEALGFYQVLLRALIELLDMQYRPHRFDYGWRYVETELPENAQHFDRALRLRGRPRQAAAFEWRAGRRTDAPARNRDGLNVSVRISSWLLRTEIDCWHCCCSQMLPRP